jgi:hypothetical protein
LEYLVHHGLEGGWAIGKAKVHDQWLKETWICSKCSLPLITLLNTDINVSPSYIKLGEVLCALESMYEVIDEEEVSIFCMMALSAQ